MDFLLEERACRATFSHGMFFISFLARKEQRTFGINAKRGGLLGTWSMKLKKPLLGEGGAFWGRAFSKKPYGIMRFPQ